MIGSLFVLIAQLYLQKCDITFMYSASTAFLCGSVTLIIFIVIKIITYAIIIIIIIIIILP